MKAKMEIVLITGFLLCLSGCGSIESSAEAVTICGMALPEKDSLQFPELLPPAAEKEASFTASYKNASVEIQLSDCICEYADEDLQIFSKFLYYDEEKFPYSGTVVYMRTPTDSMQIFFMQDYCIDKENGVIYFLFNDERGAFSSVTKYFAEEVSGDISISGDTVISTFQVWDWFADAFRFAQEETAYRISDMRLKITSLEYEQGDVILGGEASGVYSDTGEKYRINWEWNDATGEKEVQPYVFKVYDEEKDAEVFNACQEAFALFEQGDWSVVVPETGTHYKEGKIAGAPYRRMDVNGDGLPELIYARMDVWGNTFPIEFIYAYTGGMAKSVELVYVDLNDYTEYLFVGSGNNLVYDYSVYGQIDYGSYTRYQFDEDWKKQPLDRVEVYYFYDIDYYNEEEDAWYKEIYPETYGSRGGGYYFFKGRPVSSAKSDDAPGNKWVQEEITKAEFEELYYEMSGLDFFEENAEDFP
ncbi:MAG: hypothetical protein NC392_09775 [Roseburia sp.]|nr:hypothetical protein [Roseburia sp.]